MHGRSPVAILPAEGVAERVAAVYVDPVESIVARAVPDGAFEVIRVPRLPGEDAEEATYLTRIVDAIGEQERILVSGPVGLRLALEREYVTIYREPERIIDHEEAGPLSASEVVERGMKLLET